MSWPVPTASAAFPRGRRPGRRRLAGCWRRARPAPSPRSDPREANPERPTVATHAYAVAPGIVEIETGVQWQPLGPGRGRAGPARCSFKIGLAEAPAARHRAWLGVARSRRWPGAAGSQTPRWASSGTWHPACRCWPTVAVESTVKLPTGDVGAGHGHRHDGPEPACSSRAARSARSSWTSTSAIHVGAGTARWPRPTATLWTVSTGFPVAGRLGWAAELFGYPGTSGPGRVAPDRRDSHRTDLPAAR